MDEVRRHAHVGAQVGALGPFERLQGPQTALVAVFADERLLGRIFAEPVDARRKDDQLPAVRHRHARSVNRLVADPRARELRRIEVDDALAKRLFDVVHVLLLRELHRGGPCVRMRPPGAVVTVSANNTGIFP